jgi:hypothetical protein
LIADSLVCLYLHAEWSAADERRKPPAKSLREQRADDRSSGGVSGRKSVSICVQGHTRLGVTETAADGPDVVTGADELSCIPMSEIMEAEVADTGLLAK